LSILTATEAPRSFGQHLTETFTSVQVEPLTEADRDAALAFLSERPVHTVIMGGWIRERGIVNPQHRGTFYGCWNAMGILEGVALIGRATTFETHSDAALLAFAELAKQNASVQVIFAEAPALEKFWHRYRRAGQEPALLCHELLYEKGAELCQPAEAIDGLRKAGLDELYVAASAHAQLIAAETGENPLDKDSEGFYKRYSLPIEQGKVWILMQGRELIFKADVVAETPEAVYVEGLWVNPSHRRKGYGQFCWEALNRALLVERRTICGFVHDGNLAARAFYEKVGCVLRARFDKIFV
jgi:GNAT superfamily N-acetyltransferase